MEIEILERQATNMDCKYSIVMALVKRARELRRVAKEKNMPLDEIATVKSNHTKPLSVALDELSAGNVIVKYKYSAEEIKKKEESAASQTAKDNPEESTKAEKTEKLEGSPEEAKTKKD